MEKLEHAKMMVDRKEKPKNETDWNELKELADSGYLKAQQ